MSVVFVVVPVIAGGWPLVSAAIVAAGAAMGYHALENAERNIAFGYGIDPEMVKDRVAEVQLTMQNSTVISETLLRGESFTMVNNSIHAKFSLDGRGACQVHISGAGKNNLELEAAGRELMDRVRQQFAYSKVMSELEERGFNVVQEEMTTDRSIRIRVQR